jgi:glutaredoxin
LPPTGSQSSASRRQRRRAASIPRVVLYHAEGCHLCERAREVLRGELGDRFEEVDIGGDAELEARYREWLPVVEIDGERAFVYFVDPAALRRRLAQSRS